MPQTLDLSLAGNNELVEELSKRYQAAVFTGVNYDEDISVYLHGSGLLCSGLLTNAHNEIMWYSFQGRPPE